jgi:hypothetical protein
MSVRPVLMLLLLVTGMLALPFPANFEETTPGWG